MHTLFIILFLAAIIAAFKLWKKPEKLKERLKAKTVKEGRKRLIGIILVSLVLVGITAPEKTTQPVSSQNKVANTSPGDKPETSKRWYESGKDLRNSSALEWQKASGRDKLVTSANILATFWSNKSLKPIVYDKIHDVDDLTHLSILPTTKL